MVQCENLSEFTYECNPLRSPPPELLAEDLGALYKYGRLRKIRYVHLPPILLFCHGKSCPSAPLVAILVSSNHSMSHRPNI